MKLAESERVVMDALWELGTAPAKDIAQKVGERQGWKKTTTYTMINRCIAKGYIRRDEPNFICTALLSYEEVAQEDTDTLLKNSYHGSADLLVASLVDRKKLSLSEVEKLYRTLQELEDEA